MGMPEGDKKYTLGFDLGGTKMLAVVFDQNFKAVARNRKKTLAHEGEKAGLERMTQTIRKALKDAGLEGEPPAAIGVGIPGPLDPERGIVLDMPNLGWSKVPLKKQLEATFGCPVSVLNDVDAGVYGEYRFGAARGARCVVGVFPGTGIGGGCVYQGQVLMGKGRSGFEIGHVQVTPDGPLCGCGRRGCLESVASRLAIAAAAAAAAFRGEAPYLLKQAGMDLAKIRSGVLAASIKAGDRSVEQIVRIAAGWLGVGIANAINLLTPEVVLLGGGLVEAMPDLFREEIEKTARARVMPSFSGIFQVKISELGDDAVAKGAAAWALQGIGKKV
jgi:glucokinase